MEIILFVVAGILIFAFLKTYVFSSSKTKLFRNLWSVQNMQNSGNRNSVIYNERHTTFEKLYSIYDIDFETIEDDGILMELIGDATQFDGNNPRNLGVIVTSIVFQDIKSRLSVVGKQEKFGEFIKFGSGVSKGMHF